MLQNPLSGLELPFSALAASKFLEIAPLFLRDFSLPSLEKGNFILGVGFFNKLLP
jgi:hypothetical protein